MISGRGSNLQALLRNPYAINVQLVISSKQSANGICKARRAAKSVVVLPKRIDWRDVHQTLLKHRIDRVFLAGFMRVIPAEFVEAWAGKILNVHPSILPKYPGLNSIERAYEEEDVLGVTVHEVTADVDQGVQVIQRSLGAATRFEKLEQAEFSVHVLEHRLVCKSSERWGRLETL